MKNWKISSFPIITGCILLPILLTPSLSHASFSKGVWAAKNKNYELAANFFTVHQSQASSMSKTEELRLAVWLGLSQIANKDEESGLHNLHKALCIGLPEQYIHETEIFCDNADKLKTLDPVDQDMLAVAGSAMATNYWNEEKYQASLELHHLVNKLLLSPAGPLKTPASVPISELSDQKQELTLKSLVEELNKQAETAQKLMVNALIAKKFASENDTEAKEKSVNKNDPAMLQMKRILVKQQTAQMILQMKCQGQANFSADAVLKELMKQDKEIQAFAIQLSEIAKTPLSKSDCSSTRQRISRTSKTKTIDPYSKKATRAFYNTARSHMCASEKIDQKNIMATMARQMADTFGSALEAKRGNRLDSYNLARPPVMKSYRNYVTSAQQLIAKRNKYEDRSKFRVAVAKCGDRTEMMPKLLTGLTSALNRGTDDIQFYEEVLKTLLFIESMDKKPSSYNPTPILMAYRLIAEKQIQAGKVEQALVELREALTVIKRQSPHRSETNMLAWLKVLIPLINILSESSNQFGEAHDVISIIQTKQEKFAENSKKRATMDFQERAIFDAEDLLSSINVKEITNTIDIRKMAQTSAKDMGIQLPEEMLKKAESKGGEIFKQLDQVLSQDNLKEIMKQKLPEQLDALAGESSLSTDFNGTMVELARANNNNNRMFQLGMAEVYLAMDDRANASIWINKIKMDDEHPLYSSKTLAFDAYIKAKLAVKNNDKAGARKYFSTAIKYWYFNPVGALDVLDSIFPGASYLLETAAEFELSNGNFKQAVHYIELARHSNIGNHRLYGFLDKNALNALRLQIEQYFTKLKENARRNAQNLGQPIEFNAALIDSKKRIAKSTRASISPLMPLFTGLDPLLTWIEPSMLHKLMSDIEQFNDLWSNQGLTTYRKKILVAEKNKLTSESVISNHQPEYMDDDLEAFRSARESNETVTYTENLRVTRDTSIIDIRDVRGFQSKLSNDTSVVSLWLTPKHIFVFHINNKSVQGRLVKINDVQPTLERLLIHYDKSSAQDLYQKLFQPFHSDIKKRLVLLVNGSLQNIPFVALVDSQSNKYLGDKHILSYSPSLEEIFVDRSQSSTKKNALLVLAPTNVANQVELPGARKEARHLEARYNAKVYEDAQVTISLVQEEAPKYRYLHFAGHASLNRDLPDYSRLILSGTENQPASFYIEDIKALNLSGTELVVLSACESASTNAYNLNNEFSAINSAFMSAGASSVVASLHKVNDSIALVTMNKFYEHLAAGKPKDLALQSAQQYVRQNESQDPRNWAAFILSGLNLPVELSSK